MPSVVAVKLSSLFWGWIADQIGAKKPIIVVTAMLSVAVWALMAFAEWEPGWAAMALFVLLGLSGGPVGVIFAATKASVALANVGFATALVNMGAFLTAALVQSGFGIILDSVSAAEPETAPSLQSYQLALILPLAISGMGVVASLLLKERSLANERLNE